MGERWWVNAEVLNWDSFWSSSSAINKALINRGYEIWQHAVEILKNGTSDFFLADCITNLKRALNHRLQSIEELYNLKSIDIEVGNKKKENTHSLEILEKYGVVRPLLLKKLMLIRNAIEHRDSKPPNYEECSELVDVIWYFLKSTDALLENKISSINFEEDETDCGFEIDFSFEKNSEILFSGSIPKEFLRNVQTENSIEILLEIKKDKTATNSDTINEMKNVESSDRIEKVYIRGVLKPSNDYMLVIVKKFLASRA